jgi:hypothetical protein
MNKLGLTEVIGSRRVFEEGLPIVISIIEIP